MRQHTTTSTPDGCESCGWCWSDQRCSRPFFALAALVAVVLLALPAAACASGGFGIESVEVRAEEENGAPATQAGSHPYALTVNSP